MAEKKKILVVDDDPDIQLRLQTVLERAGYQVILSDDGNTGLEAAYLRKPDLIVLDLMLPGMNGYEVCKILKTEEKCKHIPVIMFTSREDNTSHDLGKDFGVDKYLPKSVELEQFLKTVNEFLAG